MTDLVSSIVSQGFGTICAGNGTLVHYGPEAPSRPGVLFVPNTLKGAEAERMLRECLTMAPGICKNPKERRHVEVVPSEE